MVGKRAAGKKRTHQETVLPLETTKQQAASDVQEEEEEEEEEEEKDKEEEKPQSENVETGWLLLQPPTLPYRFSSSLLVTKAWGPEPPTHTAT